MFSTPEKKKLQQPFFAALGQAIRRRRNRIRISQETLGLDCFLNQSYISDVERGEKNIGFQVFLRLAARLGVPPHILLQEILRLLSEGPHPAFFEPPPQNTPPKKQPKPKSPKRTGD